MDGSSGNFVAVKCIDSDTITDQRQVVSHSLPFNILSLSLSSCIDILVVVTLLFFTGAVGEKGQGLY